MTSNADIARSMADNMTHSAVPLYGKRLRLPDRGAIIGIAIGLLCFWLLQKKKMSVPKVIGIAAALGVVGFGVL